MKNRSGSDTTVVYLSDNQLQADLENFGTFLLKYLNYKGFNAIYEARLLQSRKDFDFVKVSRKRITKSTSDYMLLDSIPWNKFILTGGSALHFFLQAINTLSTSDIDDCGRRGRCSLVRFTFDEEGFEKFVYISEDLIKQYNKEKDFEKRRDLYLSSMEFEDIDLIPRIPEWQSYFHMMDTEAPKVLGNAKDITIDYIEFQKTLENPFSVSKFQYGDIIVPSDRNPISYINDVDLELSQILMFKSQIDDSFIFIGNFKGIIKSILLGPIENKNAKKLPIQSTSTLERIEKYKERLLKIL